MFPQTHFLIAFFVAEILVKLGLLNHWHALIAGIIAVLIDVDHYFAYIKKTGNWNIKKAFNNLPNTREDYFFHIWQGYLFLTAICVALFFINKTAFWISITAVYTHILIDPKPFETLTKQIKFNFLGFKRSIPQHELIIDFLAVAGILLLFLL